MLNYYEIGQRIRTARKAKNMSQEELAEKIGISVTHMSHIETGNTKLSLPVLADLAEALHVTTDSLLYPQESSAQCMTDMKRLLSECTDRQAKMRVEHMKKTKQVMDEYWNEGLKK